MKYRCLLLILLAFSITLTSCEKEEQALILPPAGTANPGRVDMGEDYDTQIFYDIENNKAVFSSRIDSWDLALEANSTGFNVFMNGGKGVLIYNTHVTNFARIDQLPPACSKTENWQFDAPCGWADSTGIGNWKDAAGATKNEVYIAQIDPHTFYKFQLKSVTSAAYELNYAKLENPDPISIIVPKDSTYNFAYFSFSKGVTIPEPPKASWDIVFTRYRHVYYELNNFLYAVNGALLNPEKVTCAADSVSTFDKLTSDNTASLPQSTFRNTIGFDWKAYNFTTGRYEVKRNKCYILHTRSNEVFKLHFLDFYSPAGAKGSPSFETERLQ